MPAHAPVSYKALLLTYLRPQRRRVIVMTLLLLTSIGLQLLNPQILRYFVDTFTSGGAQLNLVLAGALFVGIALANQAVAVTETYYSENVAWTATNQLRADLITHCVALDMSFHKAHAAGELIERVDGDVNTLANFFSQSIVHLFGNGLLIVGILVLLFFADWRIGLSISLFAAIALFALLRLRDIAVPYWTASRQQDGEFFGFLGEQLQGTEDVRANGATGYVLWRFHSLLHRWFPISRKSNLSGYSMWITSLLIFAIGNALAFALGAYLWSSHAITIGTVYLIFYYTNLMAQPLEMIRTQLQELQRAGAGIERVLQLLAMQPDVVEPPAQQATSLPPGALSIDFEHVSFAYSGDEPVLHDLSLHVEPGHCLGIVGRTGSGKTTLARLLLRLYDVQAGEIRLGGVPVRSVPLRELHTHIGMVTQDVQLFHASVRDNLTFFNRAIPDERILAAIEDVGLLSWLRALPTGLDTALGAEGEGLSAGQAQLLAFTRVFLHNPGLVILDEASSRLDPATEQLIERAVSRLLKGRTGIIIAHRLATIQRTDDILVLHEGRIVEHGSRAMLASDTTSRFASLLRTGMEEVLT